MNEKIISRCIQSQLAQLTRLENTLQGIREDAIANRPQLYEKRSTDAALRAESVACHLRELLYVTTTLPKKDYLTQAADTHGIAVHLEDGIFSGHAPPPAAQKAAAHQRHLPARSDSLWRIIFFIRRSICTRHYF